MWGAIVDQTFDINPGQEWYSQPFHLDAGQQVRFFGAGTVRFYLCVAVRNLADQYHFQRPQGNNPRTPFPFQFGSDRLSWEQNFTAPVAGDYVLVARLGVFNPPGRIRVGAEYA